MKFWLTATLPAVLLVGMIGAASAGNGSLTVAAPVDNGSVEVDIWIPGIIPSGGNLTDTGGGATGGLGYPAPEPATIALFGVGATGLWAVRRARRRPAVVQG